MELYCDYVLLLLSAVENVEALVYWSSENVTHYHLVHILSWPVLIFIIYYCVHSLRNESFRVSVHNRKHLSELNLNTLWSFQSDAVTHRYFWPGLKMLGKRATVTEIQAAISLAHHTSWMENIIIKMSDKTDDGS